MSAAKIHALCTGSHELYNRPISKTSVGTLTFLAQLSPIWFGKGILHVPLDLIVASLHYWWFKMVNSK